MLVYTLLYLNNILYEYLIRSSTSFYCTIINDVNIAIFERSNSSHDSHELCIIFSDLVMGVSH